MGNFISYELLPIILNMSLTASVVILCVLLARLLLKKAPKVFSYALWAVVLFRLLCPVSINASFSLLGVVDAPAVETTEHTTVIEYVPQDIVHTPYPQVQLPPPTVGGTAVNDTIIHDTINNSAISEMPPQAEEQTAADPLEAPMAVATFAWLAGILVMAVYSVISYTRLKGRLVGAARLRDNIYLADHIGSPFVMGIFRPKIYLPSSLPEQEQGYILLHEQHHIRRLDHVLKALAFVALCIHWFNPLVWLAFVLSGKDMEMSCDEAVVKKLGEDIRADYSASLLSLATGRRIIAGTPLAFGEGDTKSRIKNMLNWKRPKTWIVLLAAVACVAVLVACVTNPADDSLPDEEQNEGISPNDFAADSLEALLSGLHGTDIAEVEWLIGHENKPAATEVATLIRNAANNGTVSHEPLTADGEAVDGFWWLDIRIAGSGADWWLDLDIDESGTDWDADDILHLRAGIDENIVEIDGGANLPEGPIWVEDEALYQLIRTSMDVPDDHGIDAEALSAYRDIVDAYLAQVPYAPSIIESARQELTSLYLAAEREDLGAKIYCIGSVTIVEPAEKAPYLLAGGAYVDSRLRIHGSNESNLLVVVDGEAVGFVNWMWLDLDRGLENCESKEDLIRIAQNFGGVVQTQQALPLELYTEETASEEQEFSVSGEKYYIQTRTETPYFVTKSGERYRLPLPYADEDLHYAALENTLLDSGAKTYSYEATVSYQVRGKDGSVLTQPGIYYYTVDLTALTYTVRFVAAAERNDTEYAPTGVVLPEISALLGDWRLDVPYTEAANGISHFGTEIGGAALRIGSDRTIGGYIGNLSFEGTCQPDGDTGRYVATVTVTPDDREVKMTFYAFRGSGNAATYLAMDYGNIVLFWTQGPVSGKTDAASAADLETVLSQAVIDHYKGGDNGAFRTESHLLHDSEESGNLHTAYASVFYAAYDSSGKLTQEVFAPVAVAFRYQNGVYTLQDFWEVQDYTRYEEEIRDKFPQDVAAIILRDGASYETSLRNQCSTKAAAHFKVSSGTPLNAPFTGQPIEWRSPLNGMFERTYETQLSMLGSIDQTNPPFFKEQTLEFDTCAVLLGNSLDPETSAYSGTAYILFRDGALGRLPLPLDANGFAVCPETVEKVQWFEELAYVVAVPGFGFYSYRVDLNNRTVSMTFLAMPTEEDIHAALMANYPGTAPEGAEHLYSTEAHYNWAFDYSCEEASPVCTVYSYVYFASFEWYNGRQKWVHPSYVVPVEMVFHGGAQDYWRLTDFWIAFPDDTDYESSVRDRFPALVADRVLGEIDSDLLAELNTRVYESAAAYYATLSGLPGPKVYTPADVEFTGQSLNFKEKDNMSYSERLEWVRSGAADSENSAYVSMAEYWENGGVLAYLCQWVGTPHLGQYVFNLRFADGSTALLPLPRDGFYASALPDSTEFRDGKFIYEKRFTDDLFISEGETLIHLKGTYRYEVDLHAKTVSLTVIQ